MAKKINDARVQESTARIANGKDYFDYLFKIGESYTGSARVFTGISTLFLSMPFFNLKEFISITENNNFLIVLMLLAFVLLILSIGFGAWYQFFFVQLIENEVEDRGREYEVIVDRMKQHFRRMVVCFLLGATLSIVYLISIFFVEGQA
jgi:hypothetical protein